MEVPTPWNVVIAVSTAPGIRSFFDADFRQVFTAAPENRYIKNRTFFDMPKYWFFIVTSNNRTFPTRQTTQEKPGQLYQQHLRGARGCLKTEETATMAFTSTFREVLEGCLVVVLVPERVLAHVSSPAALRRKRETQI